MLYLYASDRRTLPFYFSASLFSASLLQQAFFSPLTFPVESLVQQLFAFPAVHLSQHCLSAVQSPLHLSQQDDALAQQAFSSPTLHLSQHLFAVVHSFVHLSQQGVSLQQLVFFTFFTVFAFFIMARCESD
jgi:hypothetical protein